MTTEELLVISIIITAIGSIVIPIILWYLSSRKRKVKSVPFRSKMVNATDAKILETFQKETQITIEDFEVNKLGFITSIDLSSQPLHSIPKSIISLSNLQSINFSDDSFKSDDEVEALVWKGLDVKINGKTYKSGQIKKLRKANKIESTLKQSLQRKIHGSPNELSREINVPLEIIKLSLERFAIWDPESNQFWINHEELQKSKLYKIITFRGAQIPQFEVNVLQELEDLRNKQFRQVDEINPHDMGFVVEKNRVVGLSLGSWGNNHALTIIPESICDLSSLRTLDLRYNEFTTLPKSIGKLKSLTFLNLESNRFAVLPESICNLKSLQELDLNSNQLTSLPESFGNLTSLKILTLEHNRLRGLPESFGNLTSLQELDLWENQNITNFPESILKLTSLKKLSINGNKITAIPESIDNLKSLRILRLSMNQLTSLPETLGNLKSLQVLTLGWNPLKTLPDSIGNLTSLKELDLWDSELTTFPESICNLTSLEELKLGNNKLTTIPESISNLKSLKDLRLYENRLTSLPESIGYLKSLQNYI